MRPLELDFAGDYSSSRWAGWAILAVSILFAVDLSRSFVAVRDEAAQLEARLGRSGMTKDIEPGRAPRAAAPEEFAEARAVVARFATPWSTLFAAVESVQLDEITLLAIEPDPASGNVQISGEARNYLALLTFVGQLERQPGLTRVHLARHEVRESEPRRPLSFTVSAQWRRL